MPAFELIQAIASAATAIGVAIAAWQLFVSRSQAQSQFEDSFSEHYRGILNDLPLDALLGRELRGTALDAALRAFYNYFDLSNEQAFLAARGRIRKATWKNWREGIEQHLRRPGFRQAWERLRPDLDGSFDDLRALMSALQDGRTKHSGATEPKEGTQNLGQVIELRCDEVFPSEEDLLVPAQQIWAGEDWPGPLDICINCQRQVDGSWNLWTEASGPKVGEDQDEKTDEMVQVTTADQFCQAYLACGVDLGCNPDLDDILEHLDDFEREDPSFAAQLRKSLSAP